MPTKPAGHMASMQIYFVDNVNNGLFIYTSHKTGRGSAYTNIYRPSASQKKLLKQELEKYHKGNSNMNKGP